MTWTRHGSRHLVEAIVASFSDRPEVAASNLSRFPERDWKDTEFWIDTSGLALYFIEHIESMKISHAIAPQALSKLREKRTNNRMRTIEMLQEFIALNHSFSASGLCYANLKGITLCPASCSDPSLRHQSDFDFLIDPVGLHAGRALLEARGYRLTGETERTLEFKSGTVQKVSLADHYKSKPVKAVELHTSIDSQNHAHTLGSRDPRLDRRVAWQCGRDSFPALDAADQFVGQALHLLGHLRGENTRPSWFLEFRRHALYRQSDAAFWQQVEHLTHMQREAALAVGLSLMLSEELFGELPALQPRDRLLQALPPEPRLWAEKYGRQAVLAQVPGTKLYLLLEQAIAESTPTPKVAKPMYRLLPRHAPPRILRAPEQDSLRLRLHREWTQFRYILYRASFHLREGARIAIEKPTWERALKQIAANPEHAKTTPYGSVCVAEGRSAQ